MNKEEIEELAFKDRKELANLNELDLLEIIEFLQNDRKQWINQFTKTHNESIDIQKENQELKLELSGYRQAILEDKDMLRLKEEAKKLKKKYENAVADYEKTMFEKEQLNSLVNSCQEEIRQLKKQLTTNQILHCDCKVDNLKNISKIEEMENQQKEFINYLEDNWKQTQDIWYIKILQKYKEIIGVPMAGLDDEEEPDLFEMIEDMKNRSKHIEKIIINENYLFSNMKECTYLSPEERRLLDSNFKELANKINRISKAVNYLFDKDERQHKKNNESPAELN